MTQQNKSRSWTSDSRNGIGYLKFSANDSFYLYDTTTNALIRVEESVFRLIDDYLTRDSEDLKRQYSGQMSSDDFAFAVEFLDLATNEYGMLQPFFKKDFAAILDHGLLDETLATRLSHLILNVTYACNQRCTYCFNSSYREDTRTAGTKFMTWAIAKKSIDYFLERSDKGEPPGISFYGGEPLLHWPLVRKCIGYIRERSRIDKNKTDLIIVTNATLITKEILDFLVANEVRLQISLDGPSSIHDASRIFPNGRGTHARVIEALEKIKKRDEHYLNNFVSLHCTFNPNNDIMDVFRYFSGDFLRGIFVMLRYESSENSSRVSAENLKRHEERLRGLLDLYLSSFRNDGDFNYSLFHNVFLSPSTKLSMRVLGRDREEQSLNGSCIPGARRLFVDSEGAFFPCERFANSHVEIGDFKTGISVRRVRRILRKMAGFCDEICQRCWAYRLCGQCLLHAMKNGRLDKDTKAQNCIAEREKIAEDLTAFTQILENEPRSACSNPYSIRHQLERHYRNM
jgi:uncharacterized protein